MSMAELEEHVDIAKLSLAVSIKRDHIQGRSDAPVTLVEYGDYECPYCGQAYIIVKELPKQREYKKKFWDMHDLLYENQQALDYYHLIEYASILGLYRKIQQRFIQSCSCRSCT